MIFAAISKGDELDKNMEEEKKEIEEELEKREHINEVLLPDSKLNFISSYS